MNGRRGAIAAIVLAAGLALTACGPQPVDCAQSNVRCAGLVTDFGPVTEGLSQEAWLALGDAQAEGLLQRADFIETADTRDRATNIEALARLGYDIIVTAGSGITEETVAVAKQYPDVQFIGVEQEPEEGQEPPNYVALDFHEEEAGFLAGAAAGLITQTGRVAGICEANFIDTMRRYCDGFRSGARRVNSSVAVDIIYRTGPSELLFHDVEWGQQAATRALDAGADVVFAAGEETAASALNLAASRGAMVIGAESDLYAALPEARPQLVTSGVLNVHAGLLKLIEDSVKAWPAERRVWGSVGLAPFHDFEARISPDVATRLRQLTTDLESGVLHIDVGH